MTDVAGLIEAIRKALPEVIDCIYLDFESYAAVRHELTWRLQPPATNLKVLGVPVKVYDIA